MANMAALELPNNFENSSQKINGNQITTIKLGPTKVPVTPPDFQGQFYYYEDEKNDPFLYVASGTALTSWTLIDIGDIPDSVVRDDFENNFKKIKQTINSKQIVTVSIDIHPPVNVAEFVGQLHVDMSKHDAENLYVATGTDSVKEWVMVNPLSQGPIETKGLAKLDEANDFSVSNQTIKTRPIMSAIINSIDPPIKPEYIGQVYVKFDGTETVNVWIANGIADVKDWKRVETILPGSVVMKDKSNNFINTDQFINGSQMVSAIIKDVYPPEHGRPTHEGQLYVYCKKLPDGTFSTALWAGIDNDGKGLAWVPMQQDWTKRFCDLESENYFLKKNQYLGARDDAEKENIVGSRIHKGQVYDFVTVQRVGETVIQETTESGELRHRMFVGVIPGKTDGWYEIPMYKKRVGKITFINVKDIIVTGVPQQMEVSIDPDDAPDKRVTWSVDKPTVATIDSNGIITAKVPGTVAVIATSIEHPQVSAKCNLEIVPQMAHDIKLPGEFVVKAGQTIQLTGEVLPPNTYDKSITWSCMDPELANVSEDGRCIGLTPGQTEVFATKITGPEKIEVYTSLRIYDAMTPGKK